MIKEKYPLVSIIMPTFNCENYILETINSVLNQTYKNFNLIIVDDCSTDKTVDIIKNCQLNDKRIKLYKLNKNSGASYSRNLAIKKAKGKYIAFLDGDDMWYEEKLEKHIKFMEENNIYFSYTDYEYIDENSRKLNIFRKAPKRMSYFRMLLGNSIGCLTVIYNKNKVGLIQIPPLKKRNDYAIWCKALKKVKVGYKYEEILSIYRKTDTSLSSGKKVKLLKYHYKLHRVVNEFNPILAMFFTMTNGYIYLLNRLVKTKELDGKYEIRGLSIDNVFKKS